MLATAAASPQTQVVSAPPVALSLPIPPDTDRTWDSFLADAVSVRQAARTMRCSNGHAAEMLAAARDRSEERNDLGSCLRACPRIVCVVAAEGVLKHSGVAKPAVGRGAWTDVALGFRRVPV